MDLERTATTTEQYDVKNTLNRDNLICLDCETTGLDPTKENGIPRAEILTLSIIDGYGNVLFDQMFKPEYITEWSGAEAVNGISPQMVSEAPAIKEYLSEIQNIFDAKTEILGYNVVFDVRFLKEAGITIDNVDERIVHPTMQDFALVYGDYNPTYDDYKWQKLTTAAAYIDYEWTGKAHGSLADAQATLALAEWLYDKGNYHKALDKLQQSNPLRPNPNVGSEALKAQFAERAQEGAHKRKSMQAQEQKSVAAQSVQAKQHKGKTA